MRGFEAKAFYFRPRQNQKAMRVDCCFVEATRFMNCAVGGHEIYEKVGEKKKF